MSAVDWVEPVSRSIAAIPKRRPLLVRLRRGVASLMIYVRDLDRKLESGHLVNLIHVPDLASVRDVVRLCVRALEARR